MARKDYETRYQPWLIPSISGPFFAPERSGVANILANGETRLVYAFVELINRSEVPATIIRFDMEISSVFISGGWRNVPTHLAKDDVFPPTRMTDVPAERGIPLHALHLPVGTMRLMPQEAVARTHDMHIHCRVDYTDGLGNCHEMSFAYTHILGTGAYARPTIPLKTTTESLKEPNALIMRGTSNGYMHNRLRSLWRWCNG